MHTYYMQFSLVKNAMPFTIVVQSDVALPAQKVWDSLVDQGMHPLTKRPD